MNCSKENISFKRVNFLVARLSFLFILIFSFFYSTSLRADASPEFYQLLGEVNAQLKTFTSTRGPQCTPDLIDKVQNALQGSIVDVRLIGFGIHCDQSNAGIGF